MTRAVDSLGADPLLFDKQFRFSIPGWHEDNGVDVVMYEHLHGKRIRVGVRVGDATRYAVIYMADMNRITVTDRGRSMLKTMERLAVEAGGPDVVRKRVAERRETNSTPETGVESGIESMTRFRAVALEMMEVKT